MTPLLIGIICALLSLGHKVRLGHRDTIDGNAVLSIAYELVAIVCIAITLLAAYFGFGG